MLIRLTLTALALLAPAKAPPAPLDIQADAVALDPQAGVAVFTGQVRVVQGAVRLTCARLTARLDGEGALISLEAEGVTVSAEGWQATAERAHYTRETDELSLTGSPTVVRGETRLTGARILLWPGTGKARVEQPRGRIPAPPLLDLDRALRP